MSIAYAKREAIAKAFVWQPLRSLGMFWVVDGMGRAIAVLMPMGLI
jgi:hypothetical protein